MGRDTAAMFEIFEECLLGVQHWARR
jgi:hypothetical protein